MIFDKGANSVVNTQMIQADNLQYITGKKLNPTFARCYIKYRIFRTPAQAILVSLIVPGSNFESMRVKYY